jgi:hypothetical protein
VLSKYGLGKNLLLDSEEFYLRGLNPDDEWGFMQASKKDRTFAKAYPQAWQKMSQTESGQFSKADGINTFTTIRPFTAAQISSTGSRVPDLPCEKPFNGPGY